MEHQRLRPLERAVARLADGGMSRSEIAWRFRRSPGHIDRVLEFSRLPRSAPKRRTDGEGDAGLRPVERLVIQAKGNGIHPTEIAARMRRSPEYVMRVARFARLKQRAS